MTIGPYVVAPHAHNEKVSAGGHDHSGGEVGARARAAGVASFAGARLVEDARGAFGFQFPEATWLLGFETRVFDDQNRDMTRDLNCHMFVRDSIPRGRWWNRDEEANGLYTQPFRGLHTDGFTRGLRLPPGYGLYYEAGAPLQFLPKFNNTTSEPVTARIEATIDYVPAAEMREPIQPLRSVFLSVSDPLLYEVERGVDVRELTYRFPTDGTIHVLATHVHDSARGVELINETRGETVWQANPEFDSGGRIRDMPVYSDPVGYPVGADEVYRVRVTYDNAGTESLEVMGALAILYAESTDS